MARAAVQIKAREVVEDLNAGLDDDALMTKYQISAGQLQRLVQKLVDGGFIEESELKARAELLARKKAEADKDAVISVEPDKSAIEHMAESVNKSMNDAVNHMVKWGLGIVAVCMIIGLVLSGEVSLTTIVIVIAILAGVCTGLSNYLKQKAQSMKGTNGRMER